jgi:hypothetical protein
MKLGLKVDECGRLQVVVAETGEVIEGQVGLTVDCGVERETRGTLVFVVYDKQGNCVVD